jgi:hypothetical protein
MSQPIDLDRLERRTFTTQFRDGLIDIEMGLLVGAVWLFGFFDPSRDFGSVGPLFIAYFVAACLIPLAGRRWITRPRLGTFKPGAARRNRIRTAGIALGAMVVLQAILILMPRGGIAPMNTTRLVLTLSAALVFFIPTLFLFWFMDFTRGYLLAVLLGTAISAGLYLESGLPFLVAGALMVVIGLVALVTFLRDYPLLRERNDASAT